MNGYASWRKRWIKNDNYEILRNYYEITGLCVLECCRYVCVCVCEKMGEREHIGPIGVSSFIGH